MHCPGIGKWEKWEWGGGGGGLGGAQERDVTVFNASNGLQLSTYFYLNI